MGEQIGIECGTESPQDTSCALAFLEDQSEEACVGTTDADGNSCKYCSWAGSMNLCLTGEQAQFGESFGIRCDEAVGEEATDPYDPSCAIAYLQDQSEESCKSAVDSDGRACKYCTLQGSLNLCLNEEQAEMGEQLGIECDSTANSQAVGFPSDFWDCLQNYDQEGCSENSCTWCNTEVGIGFCLADAAADAMHECNFFDCDYKKKQPTISSKEEAADPFDPACLAAGSDQANAESNCNSTLDSNGNHCVWCNAAGVFGLCLSAEQASAAGKYLACDALKVAFAQA